MESLCPVHVRSKAEVTEGGSLPVPVATAASSMEQQHCGHRSAAEQEPILQL